MAKPPYKKKNTTTKRTTPYSQMRGPPPFKTNNSLFRNPYINHSPEVKALDVSVVTAAPGGLPLAFNATGSIIPLNLVAAGSSFFNRIGRKIELKSVDITISPTTLNVTRAQLSDIVRLMVIYDRQTNGALPTMSDFIQDTDGAGTNTTNAVSGPNLNNRDRFQIIMDKRIQFPGSSLTTGQASSVWPNSMGGADGTKDGIGCIREYRKLPGLITQYRADSTPAVIGDIASGGLYLVSFGGFAAGAELFQGTYWHTRIRYVDT